jgi:hypothetical protein
MNPIEIPLFPLNTVLFPGGVLPLRIFEPRYLGMVGSCMKSGTGFGVVALREGREAGGSAVAFHLIGTLATIADFDRLEDGLLGITCQGGPRLRVRSQRVQPDHLVMAEVEVVTADPDIALEPIHAHLLAFLRDILEQADSGPYTRFLMPAWDSAAWVGNRLAELLPLPLPVKQILLELNDPLQRLEVLNTLFQKP